MNRLIRGLVLLVVVVGILQWFVPRWAGSLLAKEMGRYDHGPRPTVAVTAIPFWELFSGHFQDVYISARQAKLGSLAVASAHLNWANGGVSLGQLEKGHLSVTQPGHLTMTIQLTAASLSQFLAQEGTISSPKVSITPAGVAISGRLLLGGTYVPLDTKGPLTVSANHQQLVFHPTSIDGLHLPVLTDIQLLNLASMKQLPVSLRIEQVKLEANQLAVTVGN